VSRQLPKATVPHRQINNVICESEPMKEFPFEEGDEVLVRVRENGDTGNIVAKFEARCKRIQSPHDTVSKVARLSLPWGRMNSVTLRPYEAEFEILK